MKRLLLGFILIMSSLGLTVAQDTIQEQPAEKPLAKPAFESGYFIADQTVVMPPAKTLEFVIQHDFGDIQDIRRRIGHRYPQSRVPDHLHIVPRIPERDDVFHR